MDWIKVTQAMPPSMEPVIVTVQSKTDRAFKDIMKDVRWDSDKSEWCFEDGPEQFVPIYENMEVTHWMPYPEPAED